MYAAHSVSRISGTPLFFWMKDKLNLTPEEIVYYTSIAVIFWTIKPVFSIIIDSIAILGSHRKSYINLSYILILLSSFYVYLFGLTIPIYIFISCVISFAYAVSDVAIDGLMCEIGKKRDILDRLQSAQWIGAGLVACFTGLAGSYIAEYYSYKLAFLISAICVLFVLIYFNYTKGITERKAKRIFNIQCFPGLKNTLKLFKCSMHFCAFFSVIYVINSPLILILGKR